MSSAKPEVQSLDGRLQRSERSRHAIVQALFDLVGEGVVQPTAQQVAERAGLGIRTVFRHFSDVESLYAAMDAKLQGEALPLLFQSNPEGSLIERASKLVERRAKFYERIAPYKRSGRVQRWRSPFLQSQHGAMIQALRADLLRWLPEIEDESSIFSAAMEAATSFELWDRMRTDQQLSRTRAQAAMERTALALAAELTN